MEIVLEGRFKEADHIGNLDGVGGEKIRAPDLNAKRGFIAGNEGFFIKGLDPTRTHGVHILHDNLQIFGTTRVPNLTNLSLAFTRRGWLIRWRGFIDHTDKTTGSTTGPSLLKLLSGPSLYAQTRRTIGPKGSTHDWASIREGGRMNNKEAESQPNTVTPLTRHTVSSEGVIFYFLLFNKLITFKLVHSYNVKHLICTILCSSRLQNI